MTEIKDLSIDKFKEQIYRCTRCSYCREMVREKDNTYYICPIRENTAGFESFIAKGKMLMMVGVLQKDLEMSPRMAEIFFTCTTCGNCEVHCPVGIETTTIFEAFRKDLQDRELGLPVHLALAKYTKDRRNPYNEPNEERLNWIPDLDKSHIDKPSKLAYFVGCTSSYRSTEISRAFYNLLVKSNIDFTILSDEYCCGSPLLRTGQIKEAELVVGHNIERLKSLGVEEVVFTCAGCQKTFEKNYKEFDGKFKVVNYMKLLENLIKDEKIKFSKTSPLKVTYHDPCHSTKRRDLKVDFGTPRNILKLMPGVELIEMKSHEFGSICCGAGGGLKSAHPELAMEIASKRIQEALDTNAEILVSSCPFCKRNLKDAVESGGQSLRVMDIVELIQGRI